MVMSLLPWDWALKFITLHRHACRRISRWWGNAAVLHRNKPGCRARRNSRHAVDSAHRAGLRRLWRRHHTLLAPIISVARSLISVICRRSSSSALWLTCSAWMKSIYALPGANESMSEQVVSTTRSSVHSEAVFPGRSFRSGRHSESASAQTDSGRGFRLSFHSKSASVLSAASWLCKGVRALLLVRPQAEAATPLAVKAASISIERPRQPPPRDGTAR